MGRVMQFGELSRYGLTEPRQIGEVMFADSGWWENAPKRVTLAPQQ